MTIDRDIEILKSALDACDRVACENVQAGRGGPFAASLHIYDGVEWSCLAGPAGNAVLETGMASAHAEDRIVQPDIIARLRAALRAIGPERARIAVVSSAESCPACHAKIEILSRVLRAEGLIAPGSFILLYGADYEDTERIAGFNDALYHEDMAQEPHRRRIRFERGVPPEAWPRGARAAVAMGGNFYAGDGDHPESAAICIACRARKESGDDTPWDLKGAVLYTDAAEIGPLTYAEAQWANVGKIVSIGKVQRSDAPDITNADLFEIITTRPYTHAHSALDIRRVTPFANRAQHAWRARMESGAGRSYNGMGG